MKNLLALSLFLASSLAHANPFDAFIGDYKAAGKPMIRKDRAKWCNRFDFEHIVGLKVEANTKGYRQSHVLYLMRPNGWSGHPAMDFDDKNEFGSGGSYAKTSGSETAATNEYGSWGTNPTRNEALTVSIQKSKSGYVFTMMETYSENSALQAACYYEVPLVKN